MRRLKFAAAIFLLVAVVLPQYTCTDWIGPDGKSVGANQPTGDSAASYQKVVTNHYAYDTFELTDWSSYLIILTFTWPVIMLAIGDRVKRPVSRGVVTTLEVLLALGSGYLIYVFSDSGERASGAYLGLTANLMYLISLVPLGRKT